VRKAARKLLCQNCGKILTIYITVFVTGGRHFQKKIQKISIFPKKSPKNKFKKKSQKKIPKKNSKKHFIKNSKQFSKKNCTTRSIHPESAQVCKKNYCAKIVVKSADLVGSNLKITFSFEKLRSESPQMLKSHKLHMSVNLRSNISTDCTCCSFGHLRFY
jgi:hypothetical protein